MHRNTLTYKKRQKASGQFISVFLWTALFYLLAGNVSLFANGDTPVDLPILHKWSGVFPVGNLNQLPEGQRESRAGFIREEKTFSLVWKTFKPDEKVPEIDFKKFLVVFSRNMKFFNRTNIFKVTLNEGVAEILAMETMSAMPIEKQVAMAMAVIPTSGVKFIQTGNGVVPVPAN